MFGLFGYYDPDHLLADDLLATMLAAYPVIDGQVRQTKKTAWAGFGIVNYKGKAGICGSDDIGSYTVLGNVSGLISSGSSRVEARESFLGGDWSLDNLLQARGGFSAVMLQEQDRSLTLLTDRFGSHALYVAQYKSAWIFASQVMIVLTALPKQAQLDKVSISTMLSIGEVIGNRTLIDGIETLPAATIVKISEGAVNRHKYWQYVYEENHSLRRDVAVESVGEALKQSVNRALRYGQAVAVPLSGGLDSRFILDLACQSNSSPVAYTWGIPECRDIIYAQNVTKRLKCRHEVFYFQQNYLSGVADKGVLLTEGHTPVTNFHVLPYVDELAGRGHDLILDGFAGDGVLGGNFFNKAWLNNPDLNSAAEALWRWRRKGFDQEWSVPEFNDMHALAGDLFKQSYQGYPGDSSMDKAMAFLIDNRVRRITTCGTNLFRSRMAVEQPFMDADVIDVIRTLPHKWRIRHHFYLDVLKRFAPQSAAAPYQRTMLPATAPHWLNLLSMAWQRGYGVLESRAGFPHVLKGKSPSDFSSWFRHELRPYVESILLSDRTLARSIVAPDLVRYIVNAHMQNKRDFTALIGAFLSVELFCRLFLDDL